MRRGDFVRVALPGAYGKPRPALIIQSDAYSAHSSVTLLPVSGTLIDAPLLRVRVDPDEINNLQKISQVMVDKLMTLPREKISPPFGKASDQTMLMVSRNLTVFLGIAG